MASYLSDWGDGNVVKDGIVSCRIRDITKLGNIPYNVKGRPRNREQESNSSGERYLEVD